ncbi:hypothetical protein MKW98_023477 [Papaver atlanticum]|uniref:Uncharacterized protein n=1 Tax=Papaver atlanticum TaxID=357466 RepID=A0AAD4XN37_9MAGN|nr:hypothetical protein MKW98_023477 [Papaver atlanticum]
MNRSQELNTIDTASHLPQQLGKEVVWYTKTRLQIFDLTGATTNCLKAHDIQILLLNHRNVDRKTHKNASVMENSNELCLGHHGRDDKGSEGYNL